MNQTNNKNSFKDLLSKLNEVDVNDLIASLQKLTLDDIKKIDIKKISGKVKDSPLLKPSLGILSASLLFTFLLLPKIEILIATFTKARQYQNESNSLEFNRKQLDNSQKKFEQVSLLMSEINQSILAKDQIIFVAKLVNEASIKANVEVTSFSPIEAAKSAKLCQQSNQFKNFNSNSRKNVLSNKGAFNSNFYELNLTSDYLNLIEFLNVIQYYDVTIIPHCINVTSPKDNKISANNNRKDKDVNPTVILRLSQSGKPLNTTTNNKEEESKTSYGRVESRIVLKIPSHSR